MTFWIDTGLLFVFTFGIWIGWWIRGLVMRTKMAYFHITDKESGEKKDS